MKHRHKFPGKYTFALIAGVVSILFMAISFAANTSPPVQDNRNYQEIQGSGKARISNYTPEWTDMKPSDPGTTILDMNGAAKIGDISTGRQSPATNKLPPVQYQKASKTKAQPSSK